jgi:hypothetical protein
MLAPIGALPTVRPVFSRGSHRALTWPARVVLPGPVVRAAPEYNPAEPLEPHLEARLARYYGPPPFDAV